MFVLKRDGSKEPVRLDRITERIADLNGGLYATDPVLLATKVVASLRPGIQTSKLDVVAAEIAARMAVEHPAYGLLAGRILKSNHEKTAPRSFREAMKRGEALLNSEFLEAVRAYGEEMDGLVSEASIDLDYRAFLCLQRSYLLRKGDEVLETPEMLAARVSLAIHHPDVEAVVRAFRSLVSGQYVHATPTLANAGMICQQLSSCFLLTVQSDSISGIYKTLSDTAEISRAAGGIGLDFSKVRSAGARIHSTNGVSSGIVPFLRVFDASCQGVNQAGKRPGAMAVYLEVWHADVLAFLELRLNQGHEKSRARDLFYALWVCDLFMQRVRDDEDFTLFCPTVAVNDQGVSLQHLWGASFEEAYGALEALGVGKKVRAHEVWDAILRSQTETGLPYFLFKDTINSRSPQMNLGTITMSNLCTEIMLYVSPEETAVCNLGSMALPAFLRADRAPLAPDTTPHEAHEAYDYEGLGAAVEEMVTALNRVIDKTHYPTKEAKTSNMRHRPIAVGVQGLGTLFHRLRIPFTGPLARVLNARIFECIYYHALLASCNLARSVGTYESFAGSPASEGLFQFDLMPEEDRPKTFYCDWPALKRRVAEHGLRNSTVLAAMPTVSTSSILGNSESFEVPPLMTLGKSLSGEFPLVNKELVEALSEIGMWSEATRNAIIASGGSIQGLEGVPASLKNCFKNVWETSQKDLLEMNAERGAFVDQSQSMNIFLADPAKLSSALFAAWKMGVKNTYYVRTRAAASPLDFSAAPSTCQSCSA
jgi:ribonucleoside-diphosphate reductase alpha subunit